VKKKRRDFHKKYENRKKNKEVIKRRIINKKGKRKI
jgi:hypothetical protein